MDGSSVGETSAFVARLDAWLDAQDLSEFVARHDVDLREEVKRLLPLQRALFEEGFLGEGWPVEIGGRGGAPTLRGLLYERLCAAGLDLPKGLEFLEIILPTFIRFAPALAKRHLVEALRGDILLCQGFSESEAGSDLAAVRTRAVPEGEHWVVTGQKTWIGNGHRADWCLLLVRTGTPESRHRGLTMLWLDMTSVGVETRPIAMPDGRDEFAELFLDGVRIPVSNVVGEVNGGWAVAMYLLQFERANWAWQRRCRIGIPLRQAIARSRDQSRYAADIGRAWLDWVALGAASAEAVRTLSHGVAFGPESSLVKLLLSSAERSVADLDASVDRPRELVGDAASSDWFYPRATAVFGGAAEVQKDIVAARVLGMAST